MVSRIKGFKFFRFTYKTTQKLKKNVSKFVEKLNKFRIMFKDILTFLGLEYGVASLIKLYFVVLESVFQKSN